MSQFRMEINLTRCAGCGVCAMACKLGNNTPNRYVAGTSYCETFNWADYAVRKADPSGVYTIIPVMCNHCAGTPKCVSVCPRRTANPPALKKDPNTGIVLHNPTNCLGCQNCRKYCPYSAAGSALSARTAQYSVISYNYQVPHSYWSNNQRFMNLPAIAIASPNDVKTRVGATPPYRRIWEDYSSGDILIKNIRSQYRPEKCTFCYHRHQGDTNVSVWGDPTSGSFDPDEARAKAPYCVLACPAKARRVVLATDDSFPEGARVLAVNAPYNPQLVDANSYTPPAGYTKPQTYYVGKFSQRELV